MAEQRDTLLEHDYDGIRELDNDLPRWWLWLFYLTIVYAVLYMLYFHVFGIGYLSGDEYRREMNPLYVRSHPSENRYFGVLPKYHAPYADPQRDLQLGAGTTKKLKLGGSMETRESDTMHYVALSDPTAIEAGHAIFTKNCVSCHGPQAQGLIGPNLTDDYWIHGAGMTNVVKSIKFGYPTKGMVAWRAELKPDQILQVASFVLSIRGSNPPNPKAPQGDLVTEIPQ